MGEQGRGTKHDALLDRLRQIAETVLPPLGLEHVELSLRGNSRRRTLRVDIDRPGPTGVTHEDCKLATHALSERLDAEDYLENSYVLEVSSPGIDRPIASDDDVRRNRGRQVRAELRERWEGLDRIDGELLGRSGDRLQIRDRSGAEREVPWEQVATLRQHVEF